MIPWGHPSFAPSVPGPKISTLQGVSSNPSVSRPMRSYHGRDRHWDLKLLRLGRRDDDMQESHKRTTPVLDFQRQSPEHQLPPRFARLVTPMGPHGWCCRQATSSLSSTIPLVRWNSARRSDIPGRDSNIELRPDARLQGNLGADYTTLWVRHGSHGCATRAISFSPWQCVPIILILVDGCSSPRGPGAADQAEDLPWSCQWQTVHPKDPRRTLSPAARLYLPPATQR